MNILIVKLSALGDVIHALPVTAALKNRYPNSSITWVVEPPAYDLVKHNPLVDEIIIFEKQKFKSWQGLIHNYPPFKAKLKQKSYDLSIDLQGLFKSAAVAWTAGAKQKIGYWDMREGANLVSKPIKGANANGHVVDRYLDTLSLLPGENGKVVFPWQTTEAEVNKVAMLLAQEGITTQTEYVALAVGTNWENKCWASEKFAELVDLLAAQGLKVVLLGYGAKDEARGKLLQANTKEKIANYIGKTSLGETAELIKKAKAVVGGDTGNLHLAAALNTPAIMLMGPTNPERNGPYGQLHNVLVVNRPCAGCWQRKCPKALDCLALITAEQVMEKILALNKKEG